jgi:hypothetical protein
MLYSEYLKINAEFSIHLIGKKFYNKRVRGGYVMIIGDIKGEQSAPDQTRKFKLTPSKIASIGQAIILAAAAGLVVAGKVFAVAAIVTLATNPIGVGLAGGLLLGYLALCFMRHKRLTNICQNAKDKIPISLKNHLLNLVPFTEKAIATSCARDTNYESNRRRNEKRFSPIRR